MLAESTLAKVKCTLPVLFHLHHLVNCLHREAVATLPLCGKMRAQDKVRNWSAQGAAGSQEHRGHCGWKPRLPWFSVEPRKTAGAKQMGPRPGELTFMRAPFAGEGSALLTFPQSLRNPERPQLFLLSPTPFSDAPPTLRAL